jgi:hypothetical protein
LDYLIHSFKVAFTDEWCCFASAETKAGKVAIRSYAKKGTRFRFLISSQAGRKLGQDNEVKRGGSS